MDNIKDSLNKIRMYENKTKHVLDNGIRLYLSDNVGGKNELVPILNGLADVISGHSDKVLFDTNSGEFTISFKLNIDSTVIDIILSSNRQGVMLGVDKTEVLLVTPRFVNILSGLTRFFNDKSIATIKNVINGGLT